MSKFLAFSTLAMAAASFLPAQSGAPASIAYKTAGMRKLAGYFPLYWEAQTGKLWLEIDKFEQEFLYVVGLPAGIGSNDIGLDRGQLGPSRIVRFERSGNKVLLVQKNYGFRAITDNADERRAVEEAFAQSILWGGEVAAEDCGGAFTVSVEAGSRRPPGLDRSAQFHEPDALVAVVVVVAMRKQVVLLATILCAASDRLAGDDPWRMRVTLAGWQKEFGEQLQAARAA